MENKKTYLDVINETVEYYSADPKNRRSISESGLTCLYNGPDGKQCAFARCAEPINGEYEEESCNSILYSEGYDILKPEYRHLKDEEFWMGLQNLHDDTQYWTNTELSVTGELEVSRLCEIYS